MAISHPQQRLPCTQLLPCNDMPIHCGPYNKNLTVRSVLTNFPLTQDCTGCYQMCNLAEGIDPIEMCYTLQVWRCEEAEDGVDLEVASQLLDCRPVTPAPEQGLPSG